MRAFGNKEQGKNYVERRAVYGILHGAYPEK